MSSHSRDVDASDLSPVLSTRWALSGRHLVVCLLFGGLFLYLNYRPLLDSRIWLHLQQGHFALEHAALPAADAAQPLTEGMDVVVTCWLSQTAFALADRLGGPQYVSNLFALAVLGYFLVLARVFYLQTRRVGLMLAGVGLVLLLGRRLEAFAHPEVFGTLSFAVLLWIVTRIRASGFGPLLTGRGNAEAAGGGVWRHWLAIGGLFVVWANLHPSFLLGIAFLACYAVGRAVEVAWKTRSVRAVISDRLTQRWVLLTQWAAALSLLNPYGLRLVLENVRLYYCEPLREMPQWLSLNLSTVSGVLFVASFAALAAVLRHSRRRVGPVEVLLLLVFAVAALPAAHMMAWYAGVFAFVLTPHLKDIATRLWPDTQRTVESPEKVDLTARNFAVSLICLLVIWCAFALAPISQDVLGAAPRKPEHVVGPGRPRGATEFLRKQPSHGLVFAPLEWADRLAALDSPEIRVYMTSNLQWVPRQVWSDYGTIARAQPGWERALDRYDVGTVVVKRLRQDPLHKAVKQSEEWNVVYEDEISVIARRVE